MSEQLPSKAYLNAERLEIIKQSPRQADITDIEDMCDEIERLQSIIRGKTFVTGDEPSAMHEDIVSDIYALLVRRGYAQWEANSIANGPGCGCIEAGEQNPDCFRHGIEATQDRLAQPPSDCPHTVSQQVLACVACGVVLETPAGLTAAATAHLASALPPTSSPPAVIDEQTEDEYVIDRLGGLLAEIAVALKGEQPAGTLWSYHDLPEMVRKLVAERTSQPPSDDAARYQWLRSRIAPSILSRILSQHRDELIDGRPEALDAEIDRRLGLTKGAAS